MKVLIIDDDKTQRLFLNRLLRKQFNCTVFEAKNGLEGLSVLQEEKPDLIMLDVMMPVMDGKEFLEIIRKDQNYVSIPVIMLSATNEKESVVELIKLGVTDYLVKPISAELACDRLERIVTNLSHGRHFEDHSKENSQNVNEKLLLIHKEEKFREWFRALFSKRYDIIEGKNGADGMGKYLENKPSIICVGEGLPLLNEQLLARKIRDLNKDNETGIYLISEENAGSDVPEKEYYNGILKQSYNIGDFLSTFSKTVLKEDNVITTVFSIASEQIRETLVNLLTQTMDVFSEEELLAIEDCQDSLFPCDVYVVGEMYENDGNNAIAVALFGSSKNMLAVAEKILKRACTIDQDALEAFGDGLHAIGGGIKNLLERYDVAFDDSEIRVRINPYENEELKWNIMVPIQFNKKELIGVGVVVKRKTE